MSESVAQLARSRTSETAASTSPPNSPSTPTYPPSDSECSSASSTSRAPASAFDALGSVETGLRDYSIIYVEDADEEQDEEQDILQFHTARMGADESGLLKEYDDDGLIDSYYYQNSPQSSSCDHNTPSSIHTSVNSPPSSPSTNDLDSNKGSRNALEDIKSTHPLQRSASCPEKDRFAFGFYRHEGDDGNMNTYEGIKRSLVGRRTSSCSDSDLYSNHLYDSDADSIASSSLHPYDHHDTSRLSIYSIEYGSTHDSLGSVPSRAATESDATGEEEALQIDNTSRGSNSIADACTSPLSGLPCHTTRDAESQTEGSVDVNQPVLVGISAASNSDAATQTEDPPGTKASPSVDHVLPTVFDAGSQTDDTINSPVDSHDGFLESLYGKEEMSIDICGARVKRSKVQEFDDFDFFNGPVIVQPTPPRVVLRVPLFEAVVQRFHHSRADPSAPLWSTVLVLHTRAELAKGEYDGPDSFWMAFLIYYAEKLGKDIFPGSHTADIA